MGTYAHKLFDVLGPDVDAAAVLGDAEAVSFEAFAGGAVDVKLGVLLVSLLQFNCLMVLKGKGREGFEGLKDGETCLGILRNLLFHNRDAQPDFWVLFFPISVKLFVCDAV